MISRKPPSRRGSCTLAATFAACVVGGLVAASLGAPADERTFLDVPTVGALEPKRFRGVLESARESARESAVRVAIFGDSQETAPNGWGGHYIAHLNAAWAKIYGPASESTFVGNSTHVAPPQWLCSVGASATAAPAGSPSEYPPGVFAATLPASASDPLRVVLLDDASRTIDPVLAGGPWFDATGPWIAEVLVRHRQGAIGIQWSNAPTDADAPDPAAAVAASGVLVMPDDAQPGSFVWCATPPLSSGKRRHVQLALWSHGAAPAPEVVGVRFRTGDRAAQRGVLVQGFSKGGMRLQHLVEEHGASGPVVAAWAPDVAVLQYGANDAGNGVTREGWRASTEQAIAWIRAAVGDPAFPVIIASDLRIGYASDLHAVFDWMPVVAHDIAMMDPNVLALNLPRVAFESFRWGPSATGSWMPYLADLAHLRPHAQRLLAQGFVGELTARLGIDNPGCARPDWADCVRDLGATCAAGVCLVATDADAAALGLGWQGAGSTCADADANGWPDVCPVPFSPDLDDDGEVGSADLGILLSAWGEPDPRVDLDRGGAVDSSDLGILLSAWGPVHK